MCGVCFRVCFLSLVSVPWVWPCQSEKRSSLLRITTTNDWCDRCAINFLRFSVEESSCVARCLPSPDFHSPSFRSASVVQWIIDGDRKFFAKKSNRASPDFLKRTIGNATSFDSRRVQFFCNLTSAGDIVSRCHVSPAWMIEIEVKRGESLWSKQCRAFWFPTRLVLRFQFDHVLFYLFLSFFFFATFARRQFQIVSLPIVVKRRDRPGELPEEKRRTMILDARRDLEKSPSAGYQARRWKRLRERERE